MSLLTRRKVEVGGWIVNTHIVMSSMPGSSPVVQSSGTPAAFNVQREGKEELVSLGKI